MKAKIGKYNKCSEQKIDIRIDPHDTYSLDHTLALIILPALIQLKDTKQGIPSQFAYVGGEDWCAQDSFDFYKEDANRYFDEVAVKRWEEVLDKMIWSFQQIVYGDWEEQYHHGKLEFAFEKSDEQYLNPMTGQMETVSRMVDKNPSGHYTDIEGLRLHHERIAEGLELFGKYYKDLWD